MAYNGILLPLSTGWLGSENRRAGYYLRGLGVHGLLELNAELFSERFELVDVLVVLALVLDLGLDAWIEAEYVSVV